MSGDHDNCLGPRCRADLPAVISLGWVKRRGRAAGRENEKNSGAQVRLGDVSLAATQERFPRDDSRWRVHASLVGSMGEGEIEREGSVWGGNILYGEAGKRRRAR